jgi:hypothetical protein
VFEVRKAVSTSRCCHPVLSSVTSTGSIGVSNTHADGYRIVLRLPGMTDSFVYSTDCGEATRARHASSLQNLGISNLTQTNGDACRGEARLAQLSSELRGFTEAKLVTLRPLKTSTRYTRAVRVLRRALANRLAYRQPRFQHMQYVTGLLFTVPEMHGSDNNGVAFVKLIGRYHAFRRRVEPSSPKGSSMRFRSRAHPFVHVSNVFAPEAK